MNIRYKIHYENLKVKNRYIYVYVKHHSYIMYRFAFIGPVKLYSSNAVRTPASFIDSAYVAPAIFGFIAFTDLEGCSS